MSYDCGQASAAARHDNRSQIFARLPIVLAEAECLLGQLGTRQLQIRLGRADRALNVPTWSPRQRAVPQPVCPIGSATVVRQRFFWIPATDTDIISAQHFWTGGPETTGPGCYDAVAIARAAVSECCMCRFSDAGK